MDASKRALGAGWAVGQGPEQLPPGSTTSHSSGPCDMRTDYEKSLGNEVNSLTWVLGWKATTDQGQGAWPHF